MKETVLQGNERIVRNYQEKPNAVSWLHCSNRSQGSNSTFNTSKIGMGKSQHQKEGREKGNQEQPNANWGNERGLEVGEGNKQLEQAEDPELKFAAADFVESG